MIIVDNLQMIDNRSPTTIRRGGGGGGREQVSANNNNNKEQTQLYVLVSIYCNNMRKNILSQFVPGPGDKEINPGVSFTTLNFKYSV